MKTTEAQKPTIWRWGKWDSHPLRKDFSYRKLQDTKNYSKGNFQPSVGSVRDRAMRRKSFLSDWRYYEIIIMKSKRKNA